MPEDVAWQTQVTILTAERARAETAAALIKRLGDAGDIAMAEIGYGDGRAEAEAVVAALSVALAEGKGADDLADLQARIGRAVAAREALARRALDLAAGAGTRSALIDLLAPEALKALFAALGGLWRRRADRDAAIRATIAARLEAGRWPPFADITPQ